MRRWAPVLFLLSGCATAAPLPDIFSAEAHVSCTQPYHPIDTKINWEPVAAAADYTEDHIPFGIRYPDNEYEDDTVDVTVDTTFYK